MPLSCKYVTGSLKLIWTLKRRGKGKKPNISCSLLFAKLLYVGYQSHLNCLHFSHLVVPNLWGSQRDSVPVKGGVEFPSSSISRHLLFMIVVLVQRLDQYISKANWPRSFYTWSHTVPQKFKSFLGRIFLERKCR